jgi:hypothetical protein
VLWSLWHSSYLEAVTVHARAVVAELHQATALLAETYHSDDEEALDDALDPLPTQIVNHSKTGDRHRAVSWIWHNTPKFNADSVTSSDPSLVHGLFAPVSY